MANLDHLRKRIHTLIEAKKYKDCPPIDMIIEPNYKITVSRLGQQLIYDPSENPTILKFHQDQSLVRSLMGPYGSGKSVGCDSELMLWAADMPNCLDGIKRCRFIVVRNTYQELRDTTIKTWLDWYGKVGEVESTKTPPWFLQKIHFQRKDIDGHVIEDGRIEMELIFLSLDSYEDLHKLDSIETTGFYINELRHIVWRLVSHMIGRVERYPKASDLPPGTIYKTGLIADTNPPPENSDFFRTFEVDKPDGYKLFKQPPALIKNENGEWIENPLRENKAGVKASYYFNQLKGATNEFIKVHILGEYGSLEEGKAVYNNYNDDIHSVDNIDYIPGIPILTGWDGGLTPAVILIQITPQGYVNVFKEICATDLFLDSFIDNAFFPILNRDCPGYELDIAQLDPGGRRDEVSGWSPLVRLQQAGIIAEKAPTNDPIIRIDAVKKLLETMILGKPRFRLSRKGCPILREGFLGKYQFKKLKIIGEDIYSNEPEKNSFSHPHDGLQYGCLKIVTQSHKPKEPVNNQQWYRTTGGW